MRCVHVVPLLLQGMQMIRTKHDNAPMVAALAALTNLQSLTLHGCATATAVATAR